MSEFKGTKGKWIYSARCVDGYYDILHEDGWGKKHSWVATAINVDNRPLNECEANAKLIASSPEMLELLKEIVYSSYVTIRNFELKLKISQLIKKATS